MFNQPNYIFKNDAISLSLEYVDFQKYNNIDDFISWLELAIENDGKYISNINLNILSNDRVQNAFIEIKDYIFNTFLPQFKSSISKLNENSLYKLFKILDSIQKEYTIINEREKDLIYFNDIIGWYYNLARKLKMFVDSLYQNQKENNISIYNININLFTVNFTFSTFAA